MPVESPYLLLIHCSQQQAEVALCSGNLLLGRSTTPADERTAITLVPTIQQLLQTVGVPIDQLHLVATTYGPGSFTSLRIGVTTAKTLAYACQIPLVGINTLDILLLAAKMQVAKSGQKISTDRPAPNLVRLHAIQSAYRGLFYWKSTECPATKPPTAADGDSLQAKFAAYTKFRTTRTATSQQATGEDLEMTDAVTEWSCGQPAADATVWPEAEVTKNLWRTVMRTTMGDLREWSQSFSQVPASNIESTQPNKSEPTPITEYLVYSSSDQALAAVVEAASGRKLIHSQLESENILSTMVELAWQSFSEIPVEKLSPEHLQPVYYRRSAAEEALDK